MSKANTYSFQAYYATNNKAGVEMMSLAGKMKQGSSSLTSIGWYQGCVATFVPS